MNTLEAAQMSFDAAQIVHSAEWTKAMELPTWEQCQAHLAPYEAKLAMARRALNMVKPYKLTPIDPEDHHMTMEEFLDCVATGGFIDYDGSGNYATETEESNIGIYPSDVPFGLRQDFTHIVWYNR